MQTRTHIIDQARRAEHTQPGRLGSHPFPSAGSASITQVPAALLST
jgi:hypothetical protein